MHEPNSSPRPTNHREDSSSFSLSEWHDPQTQGSYQSTHLAIHQATHRHDLRFAGFWQYLKSRPGQSLDFLSAPTIQAIGVCVHSATGAPHTPIEAIANIYNNTNHNKNQRTTTHNETQRRTTTHNNTPSTTHHDTPQHTATHNHKPQQTNINSQQQTNNNEEQRGAVNP